MRKEVGNATTTGLGGGDGWFGMGVHWPCSEVGTSESGEQESLLGWWVVLDWAGVMGWDGMHRRRRGARS